MSTNNNANTGGVPSYHATALSGNPMQSSLNTFNNTNAKQAAFANIGGKRRRNGGGQMITLPQAPRGAPDPNAGTPSGTGVQTIGMQKTTLSNNALSALDSTVSPPVPVKTGGRKTRQTKKTGKSRKTRQTKKRGKSRKSKKTGKSRKTRRK
jgi:hypothetical protein